MPYVLEALHERIIGYRSFNPDSTNQFIFTDQSPIVGNQVLENLKRLGAQSSLFLTVLPTAARQVECELIKTMYFVG